MSIARFVTLESVLTAEGRILLTDPKSRKVIIVEHPFLPLYIKDMIAGVLFDNLQVRIGFSITQRLV